MALPILQRQLAEKLLRSFCDKRVPMQYRTEARLDFKVRGNSVTLVESRPGIFVADPWLDMSIAQFRYDESQSTWTLYWADRNAKWHIYMDCDPSRDLAELLEEVGEDPTGIFFG
jgi:hypothetical protein